MTRAKQIHRLVELTEAGRRLEALHYRWWLSDFTGSPRAETLFEALVRCREEMRLERNGKGIG